MNLRLTILFFFFTPLIFGQTNLVLNPSFEDTTSCPTGYGQINHAVGWGILSTGGGGNPELYSTCCNGTSGCGVPSNIPPHGFQYPKSGNDYAGIDAAYYNGVLHEYIQSPLISSLQAGIRYYVSFYVNLSNYSGAWVKHLGAYFDDGQVQTFSTFGIAYANALQQPVIPQVYNTVQALNDTLNWMKIEGSFIANGTEEYITIGNFFPDSSSEIVVFDTLSGGFWCSYYYIDDICVSEDSLSCHSTEIISENISYYDFIIFPNPATNELTVDLTSPNKYFFNLFDLLGTKRLSIRLDYSSKTVDLTSVDSGVYVFTIVDSKGDIIKTDKLIIIK